MLLILLGMEKKLKIRKLDFHKTDDSDIRR